MMKERTRASNCRVMMLELAGRAPRTPRARLHQAISPPRQRGRDLFLLACSPRSQIDYVVEHIVRQVGVTPSQRSFAGVYQ